MTDRPKKPFNLNFEQDEDPIRDKDNTAPRYEPQLPKKKSAPNLAPGGFLGIRRWLPRNPSNDQNAKPFALSEPNKLTEKFEAKAKSDLKIEGGKINYQEWTKGEITSMPGYRFWAKVFEIPSSYGIDSGKISKLEIRKDGEPVVRYERGWDLRPETDEDKQALLRVRDGLGDNREWKHQRSNEDHIHDKNGRGR